MEVSQDRMNYSSDCSDSCVSTPSTIVLEYCSNASSTMSENLPTDRFPSDLFQLTHADQSITQWSGQKEDSQREVFDAHTSPRLSRFNTVSVSDAIRVATVMFCLGWFIYNSKTIVEQYLDRDTIVFLEHQRPNQSHPPAITICTHCVMCSLNSIEQHTVNSVLETNDIWGLEHRRSNLSMRTDPSTDVDITCTFSPGTFYRGPTEQLNCTSLVDVVVSMQEGHKCWTYFSDLSGSVTRHIEHNARFVLHYNQQPSINLLIGGYFVMGSFMATSTSGQPGMYLAIHDPTILPDMQALNFHVITPGVKTIFRFDKRVQVLLQPPYTTMCYDYTLNQRTKNDSDRIRSGGHSLRVGEWPGADMSNYPSRGECVLFCMWKSQQWIDNCANLYSIFTADLDRLDNNYRILKSLQRMVNGNKELALGEDELVDRIKFCAKDNRSFEQYVHVRDQCLTECPEACLVETYTQQQSQNIRWTEEEKDADFFSNKGLVNIRWANTPTEVIIHRPKLEQTEFLGTLGGHAHIWLGLSVIHVVWFVIRLLHHLAPKRYWCHLSKCWKPGVRTKFAPPKENTKNTREQYQNKVAIQS